jgi:hypothetical protein
MSGDVSLQLPQCLHFARRCGVPSRRSAAGSGPRVARHRHIHETCEVETRNGHSRRNAQPTHREGKKKIADIQEAVTNVVTRGGAIRVTGNDPMRLVRTPARVVADFHCLVHTVVFRCEAGTWMDRQHLYQSVSVPDIPRPLPLAPLRRRHSGTHQAALLPLHYRHRVDSRTIGPG